MKIINCKKKKMSLCPNRWFYLCATTKIAFRFIAGALLVFATIILPSSSYAVGRGFAGPGKDATKFTTERNCVMEIHLNSSVKYSDPYNQVSLDALFNGPEGISLRVPAFGVGGNDWAVRFAGEKIGEYTYRTVCSNTQDKGLHNQTGTVSVQQYTGTNPILLHGRLRVAEDKRHFVHSDGTDFFWLGDTWWMGLTKRLDWPEGFKMLTADRVKKGFNLIQIVAGPLPDMDTWDLRGKNEGGFPFEKGFVSVNTKFYAHADPKIKHLVNSGLMPCVVGMWGYHLPKIGTEKVKRYWRYIVARYGAYPVVWCIAGESTMPYYTYKGTPAGRRLAELQRKEWCKVARYVRKIDPYHNLLSIHPATNARDMSDDVNLFDFEMLQTGHGGYSSIAGTVAEVAKAVSREPRMPVVNSELNYEGIIGRSWQDVQRLSFFVSVFNGTAGHTYGANGIWQLNEAGKPYGPSPNGRSWGSMPWRQAAELAGGAQLAMAGKFMDRFRWWELEKHPEWVESERDKKDYEAIRCIGVARKVRLIYVPLLWKSPLLKGIESDVKYRAFYFDPCTGAEHNIGFAAPDDNGNWRPPPPVARHDWLLVLKAANE